MRWLGCGWITNSMDMSLSILGGATSPLLPESWQELSRPPPGPGHLRSDQATASLVRVLCGSLLTLRGKAGVSVAACQAPAYLPEPLPRGSHCPTMLATLLLLVLPDPCGPGTPVTSAQIWVRHLCHPLPPEPRTCLFSRR